MKYYNAYEQWLSYLIFSYCKSNDYCIIIFSPKTIHQLANHTTAIYQVCSWYCNLLHTTQFKCSFNMAIRLWQIFRNNFRCLFKFFTGQFVLYAVCTLCVLYFHIVIEKSILTVNKMPVKQKKNIQNYSMTCSRQLKDYSKKCSNKLFKDSSKKIWRSAIALRQLRD